MSEWGDLIESCRRSFGPPPRELNSQQIARFDLRPWIFTRLSLWLYDDKMLPVLREQKHLRSDGRVVWAGVVQANEYLLDAASQNTDWDPPPVLLVHSPDPYFDDHADELQQISGWLNEFRDQMPDDPALVDTAKIIRNGLLRPKYYRLPDALSGERDVYLSTTLVKPTSLPARRMNLWILPIVVHPEATNNVTVLPHDYWPAEYQEAWVDAGM